MVTEVSKKTSKAFLGRRGGEGEERFMRQIFSRCTIMGRRSRNKTASSTSYLLR